LASAYSRLAIDSKLFVSVEPQLFGYEYNVLLHSEVTFSHPEKAGL